MKNLKTLFKILLVTTVFISCDKDDDEKKTFAKEDFLEGYLATTGYAESTQSIIDTDDYEMGVRFTPTVSGNITALKVKLPAVNSALRVTIWDTDPVAIVRTEIVNLTTANLETTFDIEDLNLIKDRTYALTFNTNDFYSRRKSDLSAATYPIISGNIRIENFLLEAKTNQGYPGGFALNAYLGDLSFDFQPTE